MSFKDYLDYKKRFDTTTRFTLKPPYGLSEEEAMCIVSAVGSLMPNSPLPIDNEFVKLSNDSKRERLAELFNKSPFAYPYMMSLFNRYVLNTNTYPNYPAKPYSKLKLNAREKTFEKARAIAKSYYDFRMGINSSNLSGINLFNIPMCYVDKDVDWFKVLELIPKKQLFVDGEAQNIRQIAEMYKKEAVDSTFTKTFGNKLFFFPLEATDKFGNYYSFLKQIEIVKNPNKDGYKISISVSAIPKNNPKYMHQILRMDSGGYHANSSIKNIDFKGKGGSKHKSEAMTIDTKTHGIHIHLFSKESNFIYYKNPNTADAVGIGDLLDICSKSTMLDSSTLSPSIANIAGKGNAMEVLDRLSTLNNNMINNVIDTSFVEEVIASRNVKLHDSHIVDASLFLNALDMLVAMDNLVDMMLNISPNPVSIHDTEHIEEMKAASTQTEFRSNRHMYNTYPIDLTTINTEENVVETTTSETHTDDISTL